MSAIGTQATVVRIVHRLRTSGAAGRFAAIANSPGFPRAVARLLIELRLAGVSSAELASVTPEIAEILDNLRGRTG